MRRDVFTEDAHAWASASARRFEEAGAAMERALSAHTNDAHGSSSMPASSQPRRAAVRRRTAGWLRPTGFA